MSATRNLSSRWIDLFVDFLVTKRGLAGALRSDSAAFESLLAAAAAAGDIAPGADTDPDYDARRMVGLVLAGLRHQ